MEEYRRAELYMYRYVSNMMKLAELNERLREEESHGDVRIQRYDGELGSERMSMGAEEWYVKCEVLRQKIRRYERKTEAVSEIWSELREKSRYNRRYEVMLGIMERVYFGSQRFREYLSSEGIPERTGYRRRRELVHKVMRELRP